MMSEESCAIMDRCTVASEDYIESVGLDTFFFAVHRQPDGRFCCHVSGKGCRFDPDVLLMPNVSFKDFISDLTYIISTSLFEE